MEAHWRAMRPNLGGFLVPGSTGEGWELDPGPKPPPCSWTYCLGLARELDALVLVGMLRPKADDARAAIKRLRGRRPGAGPGTNDIPEALASLGGLRVHGLRLHRAPTLPPEAMRAGLEGILELGAPTALYQLPQVTRNEIPPDTVHGPGRALPQPGPVQGFQRRRQAWPARPVNTACSWSAGAENDYAGSLVEDGGPYHGLLLGSSNALHEPLARMLGLLESGRLDEAKAISRTITAVMDQCFALVDGLDFANPFTNACKALDHWMAWGPEAMSRPMPMLHCGRRLPETVVRGAGMILEIEGLLPAAGYMKA